MATGNWLDMRISLTVLHYSVSNLRNLVYSPCRRYIAFDYSANGNVGLGNAQDGRKNTEGQQREVNAELDRDAQEA
jgi:hypothetical protein